MDWVRLGDVCTFINGDRGVNYPSQNDLQDTGIPFINAGHLKNNMVSFDRMNYISENKYKKLSSGKIQKGDILYCIRGSLGKKAVVDFETGAIASSLVILRPTASKILPEFLAYSLDSKNIENQITAANNGSSQPNLSAKSVKDFVIKIPTLPTQFQIVQKLSKLDELILLRTRQLYSLDQLVKSRFIEMFGDPLTNPKGWKKQQLQQLVADDCPISYGIVKTGDDVPNGVPVFRPVDIVGKMPKLDNMKRTTKEISDQYKRTLLQGHELLITVRANIADTCIIGEEFTGCNVGRGIVPIRTDEEKISLEFLKAQIDFDSLNQYIKSKAKGITLIQLNMEDLRLIEFIVPPMDLQNRFISLAQQADKSKFAIQQSLEKLETLKRSLMQEYFG